MIALLILGLYDAFAGIALLSNFRAFLLPVFLLSTLKGIYTMATSLPSKTFFIMGAIDLTGGILALLLLLEIGIGFLWVVGALLLIKGIYSFFSCFKI